MHMLVRGGALAVVVIAAAVAGAAPIDEPGYWAADRAELARVGDGLIVWESNRTGRWRVFMQPLAGGEASQLSPDEKNRDHYCPHISPDGRHVVYLSYPRGVTCYKPIPGGATVPLMLVEVKSGKVRQLADAARAYFEDRAAVWIDEKSLYFIDGEGSTVRLNIDSGEREVLLKKADRQYGYLPNLALTHATSGYPTFSLLDAEAGKVEKRKKFGGCQPYFSWDGRWGYWVGGAGGPIKRIDLKTREVVEILARRDPRLPRERNYVYFPMVDRLQRVMAFAASPAQHDHFKSDYDIFVASIDPATLQIVRRPVRVTFHKKNDRFPDVWIDGETGATIKAAPPAQPIAAATDGDAPTVAEAGRWPVVTDGLIFAMGSADARDEVVVGKNSLGGELSRRGLARPDHAWRMLLGDGAYLVDEQTSGRVAASLKKADALTVEAVVRTDSLRQKGPARIVTLSKNSGERLFTLGQDGSRLVMRTRTTKTGDNGTKPAAELFDLTVGRPTHVVVTVADGRVNAYRDGAAVVKDFKIGGDFSNWEAAGMRLLFGDEADGGRDWSGALAGVAIYDRALSAAEAKKQARAWAARAAARPTVKRAVVEATLVEASTPATLKQITPYRDALVQHAWRIDKVIGETEIDGVKPGATVYVAHWSLVEGAAVNRGLKKGATRRLVVEPFEGNSQLQALVRRVSFDEDLLTPLLYDAGPLQASD